MRNLGSRTGGTARPAPAMAILVLLAVLAACGTGSKHSAKSGSRLKMRRGLPVLVEHTHPASQQYLRQGGCPLGQNLSVQLEAFFPNAAGGENPLLAA